jgi:hypothetical protein
MKRKTKTKIKGVLQDTQDPRTNCETYDTGNILSIILVLYQSTVTCIHKFRLYYSTTYNAIRYTQGINTPGRRTIVLCKVCI